VLRKSRGCIGDVSAQVIPPQSASPDCLRQRRLTSARIGCPTGQALRRGVQLQLRREPEPSVTQEGRDPASRFDEANRDPIAQHQLIELQLPRSRSTLAAAATEDQYEVFSHPPPQTRD